MSAKFKAALEARIKAVKDANKKVVKVGIVGHQRYDDDTPVAYIAAIHEYGSPNNNIPPRPFFRPTVAVQKKTWARIGKQILQNGGTVEDMLDSVLAVVPLVMYLRRSVILILHRWHSRLKRLATAKHINKRLNMAKNQMQYRLSR